MQTFLSEQNLVASVRVLDSLRLRKQFLEGWQILNAIALTPAGGGSRVEGKVPFASNHPATNQWRDHEQTLEGYLWLCKYELDARGENTEKVTAKMENTLEENNHWLGHDGLPHWYTDPDERYKVLVTHQANLYRKDPEHYHFYIYAAQALDAYQDDLVCCPDKVRKGTHKPYYYPTHVR